MNDKPTTKTNQSYETLHSLLDSRLEVAKAFCKKPHEVWKKIIEEYEISDIDDVSEIKDKVRIGYIFRHTESDMPAIFDDQPDLFMKGKGKYRAFDPYFENTYDWLWDIQSLEERIEDAAIYFLLMGMAIIETPWVTESETVQDVETQAQPVMDPVTGQKIINPNTGQPLTEQIEVPVEYQRPIKDQPDGKAKNPFKIFFSPETQFNVLLDYENCPYLFEELTMTKEKIKAWFDKDVTPSETLHTNNSEIDTTIEELKNERKDDLKRVTVYKYVGCLPEEQVKQLKGLKPWTYKNEYEIWMTKKEILQVQDLKYPVKNYLLLGNYGVMHKFFKFGDAKHLTPIVKELEQYRTQILRHARKIANPKLLSPMTADVDETALKDPNPAKIVKYNPGDGGAKPEFMVPGQLGREVGVGVEQARTDLEQTSGTFSLAQGSGVSTVKTPRGIETFSEASDRNVRRKRKKIARFIRELIKFQFQMCAKNWDISNPDTQEIILGGEENPEADIQEFIALLSQPNILAKIDIEVESLSVNKVQQKQEALDFFDVAAQHPEIFNVYEAAKDLVQNGFNKKDADRYLVPMEQIKMQAVQEFLQMLGQTNPEIAGVVAQVINQPNMAQMQMGNQPEALNPPTEEIPPAQG